MDTIHHELIRVGDLSLELVGLLDFGCSQLYKGSSIESECLVNCSVDKKFFCVAIKHTCRDEAN